MASVFPTVERSHWLSGRLGDRALAIGGPRFDALLLWGAPLGGLAIVWLWLTVAAGLPAPLHDDAVRILVAAVAILTFAHLIAVAPRAYLNREVFAANRRKLTLIPPLLVAALLLSPPLLIAAGVLAIFWDVHHSAMQTFGLSRIYDMKAGNSPTLLRETDLRLNWVLYVGPIAAGASLMDHLSTFEAFSEVGWTALTQVPGVLGSHATAIRAAAIIAWVAIVGWALIDYAGAIRGGYRVPVHKAALLGTTGLVSIAAWGCAPPLAAFAAINLFHAVQYFALVWLKEGARMTDATARLGGRSVRSGAALALFLLLCAGFGVAYHLGRNGSWLAAPFIACSLLHFWYDSFVWSVRRKQV